MLKGFLSSFRKFISAHKIIAAAFSIALIGGGYWFYAARAEQPAADFAVVARGTVAQVISVTGKVKPASEVDLSFEKGGRIAAVYAAVGERVYAGSALVSLENADLSAKIEQAKAAARVQEARLAELQKGTRPEDVLVSEVDVKNAGNDVLNDIKSAYVNSDDAIRNKVDQLFSNPRSATPQLNLAVSNAQLKTDIESGKIAIEFALAEWFSSMPGATAAGELYPHIASGKNNLRMVQNYLDKIALAVNALTPNSSISQTTIDAYKAAVLAGRANVVAALDGLTASEEKLRAAESKLALKKAGTVQEQIDGQAAEVDAARANVLQLEAELGKTVIRSPIAGIVTVQNAKRGEIAGAGSSLVSVISDSEYEIEANVPEADIAKIKIGDSAEVTLDAYGSDVFFNAKIAKIDPAETVIDGVATYKTTLQFDQNDARIKSGMTANTDISGEKRENVLHISGRAITGKGAGKTVKLMEGDSTREAAVETGLRGSDGDVEVLSGLKEGDKVQVD